MEIYLAIVWTYLSLWITIFLFKLSGAAKESEIEANKIKQWNIKRQVENDLWKDEIIKLIIKNK